MKGIILHDEVKFLGGGERVVNVLSEHLNIPVFTKSINIGISEVTYENFQLLKSKKKFLQNFLSRFSKNYDLYTSFLTSDFSLIKNIDFVIFSGNFSLFAADKFQCKKILYCHTPPRLSYDLKDEIMQAEKEQIRKILLKINANFFAKKYKQYIEKMDFIIANSHNIDERLHKFLGIKADAVIHPPVNTKMFYYAENDNFFLSTARLEPPKRINVIIEAFKEMPDERIIILSDGSLRDYVKENAKKYSNIIYKGWVSDKEKADLLSRCRALIYIPKDEDFGISPLEAMASGKKTIAANEGGLRETIISGKTGIFVDTPCNKENLIKCIKKYKADFFEKDRELCIKQAENFSVNNFMIKIKNFLDKHL